jgi:general secretion pathway protein G
VEETAMIVRQERKRNRRAAFTLMEMLVVVAIIVVLAGIGGYYLLGQLDDAKRSAAKLQAKGPLTNAVKTYYVKHNTWPQSLQQLLQGDQKGSPILEDQDALKDPWGGQFQYDPSGPMNGGRRPDIWATDPKDGTKCGNWAEQ